MQYGKPPINPGAMAILQARRGRSISPPEKMMRPATPPVGNMRPGVPGPAGPAPGSPMSLTKPGLGRTGRARK